jgi:hypothetical protein
VSAQCVSSRDAKAGKRVDPLPGVNGALSDLPSACLARLTLGDMELLPTDLDTCGGLDALTNLTLKNCGPHASAIALALVGDGARAARLRTARCFIGAGLHSLVCLDPVVEAKRVQERAAQTARVQARVRGGVPAAVSGVGLAPPAMGGGGLQADGAGSSRPSSSTEGMEEGGDETDEEDEYPASMLGDDDDDE